jgi:integrase
MPSIFKRPNSPFWFCSYRSPDGRWLKKSTKQRTRAQALAVCVEMDKASRLATDKNLTAVQARKILAEMVEFSTGEKLTSYTADSWIAEWLKNKAGGASEGTLVRYKQVTRDFLEHLGGRAKASLASITPGDIVNFRDKLRAGGRAATTCNMVVKKILSVPFEKARRLGYIPTNPCHAVDLLVDKIEKRQGEKQPFQPEEVAKIIETAEGDWQGAILAGATTGLRLGDIAQLKWEQINMDQNLIDIDMTQKTAAANTIPIHSDFMDWLKTQPKGIGKAPLFPTLCNLPVGGRSGLSQQFVGIMKRAGVVSGLSTAKGEAGRNRLKKTFHSLRHSFVSALANAGVHADIRQKLAGHADERVHQNYTHHEIETLRGAVGKIPSLRKTQSNP